MKKLVYIFLATIVLCWVSCEKSDSDNPDEDVTYTVKYSVVSTGDVVVDTIIYLNSSGVEVTVVNQNQFSHSFESVNKYHGKLNLKGKTNNGNCDYSLQILEGSTIIKDNSSSSSSTTPVSFTFYAEYSYSQN